MDYEIVPNQSAFPVDRDNQTWGLTKREAIAAIALQGLLANPAVDGTHEDIAIDAVEYTDALIKELKQISGTRE